MSTSEPPPLVDSLEPSDWQALQRFVERTLGYGFKLAIVEVAAPQRRRQIVEGLRPLLGGQPAVDVPLHRLPGENLWHELLEAAVAARSGQGILFLWGLEEAPGGGEALMEQLNVQRDLFVRDLPVPWVLFIHPGLSVRLRMVAPDFCDIAPLWVSARATPEGVDAKPNAGIRRYYVPTPFPPIVTDSPLLAEAELALSRWRLDEAQDLLSRFDLSGMASDTQVGQRALLGGMLARLRGDLPGARRALHESIQRADEIRDRALRAVTLRELAIIETIQGRYDPARELLRESIRINEELGKRRGQAVYLYDLAIIEYRQGRYEEARGPLHESLQIVEKLGDREGRAVLLHLLAEIEFEKARYEEARGLLHESLQLKEELGDRPGRATSLYLLALIEHSQGRYEEARGLLREVLQIQEELGDRQGRAAALHMLALIEGNESRYEEARELLREALQIQEELSDRQGRAASLLALGQLEAMAGRLREGRLFVQEAVGILEQLGSGDLESARAILTSMETEQEK